MRVKLEELVEEVSERTTINNQFPVLTSSRSGIYLQEDYFKKQVASKDNTGYKVIRKGEFTYRAMSDTGEFYPNKLECTDIGIVSPAYPVFKIKDNRILPGYLKYYFKSRSFQKSIMAFVQGSTRASMKFGKMKSILIDLPDKDKQNQILNTIEILEDIIDKYKLEINRLDKLIKARFVEMFEGKYDELIIGETFKTTSGGTPSKKYPEYYKDGNIKWLTSGEVNSGIVTNVKQRITEDAVNNSSAKMIPIHSILIAMYGATAGQVGLLKVETTTNQAVCSILPKEGYSPEYLYYAISSKKKWMISQCAGGAQPNISQAIIRRMKIINAPFDRQKEFANFFNKVDKSKFAVQKSLEKTQQLFDSLMQEYFG